MRIYLSCAEIAYESTQNIGVFDNLEDANQRCRDRPFADEAQHWQYDRHWVEEWEVGGDFVRVYDMTTGEVVEAGEV